MPMQALTPTLSRFAVEGAIETVGRFGVSRERDSVARHRLGSPLAREAGEGGGEGASDGVESAI